MVFRRTMSILLSMVLIIFTLPVAIVGADELDDDLIEVEAAPIDISIGTDGVKRAIDYVDEDIDGEDNLIALFTGEFASEVFVRKTTVAVQVDKNNKVLRVVSPSINGAAPSWEEDQNLEVPEGGYVLYATDNSYANQGFKKYLATNFKVNDIIKLRKNGEVVDVTDLMKGEGLRAGINLNNREMYTVTEPGTILSGSISNFEVDESYQLLANNEEVEISEDGTFNFKYNLEPKTNYINMEIYKNGSKHGEKSLIVYYKNTQDTNEEVFLWVEQGPNAKGFQTSESIYNVLAEAKDAGVTAIALDVKGWEGFASYKKNDLTGRPYVSEMTSDIRGGSNPDLDLLEEFIKHSRSLGLKIHASLNVFAEGSIHHNEFGVLDDHPEWEEEIYRHEDGGQILKLRDSHYGQNGAIVAFVNPSNPEVRDYQLKSFEEVIKNYDIDGVILDRGRYDNYFADFSDLSREHFETYLEGKGKQLVNWPEDIFKYEGSTKIDGPLINDWYTFRAGVIKSFVEELRDLVDSYNDKGKDVLISSYVGSWYDSYYLNGTNWASPNFKYNESLAFDQESLYTDDYAKEGYIEDLDFLMIGTYQSTANEIKKYITLGNVVTNGDVPLYAGMQLSSIPDPAVQREVFQAGLKNTNGLMIFDLIQSNFPMIKAALDDVEYVKDYQLGISKPNDKLEFIEGDYLNINRNEGDINIYTKAYGESTNASTWGVEIIVDGTGKVIGTVNKQQAMDWDWTNVQVNNSKIPEGGFVISGEDPSGIRLQRQLVANTYDIGDDVRASILNGFMNYHEETFYSTSIEFKGNVQVIGSGEVEVTVNGEVATLKENGDYLANVDLQLGVNEIEIVVNIDGYTTHHKVIEVTGGDIGVPLEELINEITEENLLEDDYTSGSWTELQSALKEARKVLENPASTREEMAAALFALDVARKGLVEKEVEIEVDKTKLQGKVDLIKGEALVSGDFTTDSWDSLILAMEIAKNVIDDLEATQDDVDAALAGLEGARERLQEKDKEVEVDKTKLQGKVDLIKDEALVSGDFTTDSWDSLILAMEIAQGVLDNSAATQDDVNAALAGLEMAREGLVGKDVTKEVDKSKLQNMLESIKDESLKEKNYTSDSWKLLKTAIELAEKVLGDLDATQTQIDEALLALKKAHEGLQVRTGGTGGDNVKVDKDGEKLPSTATSIFNYGLAGVISLLAGLGLYLGVRRRKLE